MPIVLHTAQSILQQPTTRNLVSDTNGRHHTAA